MGRRKTIDRNHVLEIAEEIVSLQGANKLTIDAVAKAAGISVGGVQSCFKTKEILIESMLERWMDKYEQDLTAKIPENQAKFPELFAHIDLTLNSDMASHLKAASLLTRLVSSPEHLTQIQQWYRKRLSGIDCSTVEGQQARIAFLATEGLLFLKFYGLVDLDESEFASLSRGILALVPH